MHILLFHLSGRLIITFLVCAYAVNSRAQAHCIVVDKETGTPLRDVKAYTNTGGTYVSNYLGELSVDTTFQSATIAHGGYLSRIVSSSELCDTIWLLPKANRLDEVVVWGEDRRGITSMVNIAMASAAAKASSPSSGVSFDFFDMFKKKPLSKKARKKNKEILRDWDKVYGKP